MNDPPKLYFTVETYLFPMPEEKSGELIPIRDRKACNSLVPAGSNPACLVAANSISGNFIKPNLIATITATVTNPWIAHWYKTDSSA
ncbi:hypothetical protein SDC9_170972 [bioreactor metagenome]|uniref:Uncharacterized protein n=1 Tax=bioreactor metagenome TaxID=1076179 RepID=A0A645GC00_9ZZZZ